MSAPVDVLAVMDRAFGAAHEHYDDLKSAADEPALGPAYQRACRYMAEHREARAAVAELIEALEIARKQMAHRGCGRVRPTSEWAQYGSMSFDNCECDIRRVDAVRARVKGGAA